MFLLVLLARSGAGLRHPIALVVWLLTWLMHLDAKSRSASCDPKPFRDTIETIRRGVAQSGSASALGAEGRGFESLRPDHSAFSALFAIRSNRDL